jgi:putative nucleotidyltransferase with HDIG domain
MTLEPSFHDQELLADTQRRLAEGKTRRELRADILLGLGFVAAAGAVWAISPPQGERPVGALLCIVVLALASRVSFNTPYGFTVATQLAFVPLLFTLPPALVPPAVMVALALANVPDVVSGKIRLAKLLAAPANAWFAVGPALVFALAGVAPWAAGAGLLVIALAAQFAGDFGASALYFGVTRQAGLRTQIGECWVYGIDAGLSGVGLVVAEQIRNTPAAVLAVVPLLGLLAMFADERNRRLGGLLELNKTYRGTALLLGDVIAADDGYTGEHSKMVVELALSVAERLGLDAERRRNIEFAAMLHDVGKIAIPKEIINKPGKLDAEEWRIMKTHTIEGERMLTRVGGFMGEVGHIVRAHHERWDGQGYPSGTAGLEIPLEARIIACCDAWNAMRTDRPYRPALSHETALEQLFEGTGSQFDPSVVRALVQIVGLGDATVVPTEGTVSTSSAAAAATADPIPPPVSAPPPAVPVVAGPGSERAVAPVADDEAVVVAVEAHHGDLGQMAGHA